MAAANASIGVSRAAFYPNITLSAAAGFQDNGFNLLSLPNSLWSVGAGAVLPLFEGGLRRAALQRSWSQYAQARDNYRSTVLSAFQEVEDGLALTVHLRTQARQQAEAVAEARKAQNIAMQLYVGGLTNYLDVVVAQETELTAHTVRDSDPGKSSSGVGGPGPRAGRGLERGGSSHRGRGAAIRATGLHRP